MLRWSVYLAWRFVLFAGCGGRWLWPRSAFKGTYRPRRILPVGKMLRCAGCLARRGGRRWLPRSAFKGTYRPRRILLAAKCYGGRYVWRGVLFCGKMLRGSVYLARGFVLFAGFVQFLLLNKNCTRLGGLQGVCCLLLISRAVRDAFCLAAKCYEADGREMPRSIFRGRAVCNAFCLSAKRYEDRLSGAAGCFVCGL